MLTGLSIKNVVLIESLNLELEAGLTALTGETGAGKSIILDALGMATGARSDRGLVRSGADSAQVIAQFTLPKDHTIWRMLDAAGIEADSLEPLILRRIIKADGRSRAFINDGPVSAKLLSDIGGELLEVHGQYDGRGLMDPSRHVDMLDAFGGYTDLLGQCAACYAVQKQALLHLEALTQRQAQASADKELYEHAIAEIDRLNPQSGEDEALANERRFLQGAEGALSELSAAQAALGEAGEFENRLGMALAGIERIQLKFADTNAQAGAALSAAVQALEKAMLETQDARAAVSDAATSFDVEPGRLDAVEQRLFALRAAARKYNVDIDQLPAVRTDYAQKLSEIASVDADMETARADVNKAERAYNDVATALTQARRAAADVLKQAIMAELPPLKMERAEFTVDMSDAADSAKGRDKVQFMVSTNPGTPVGALQKIASGGELARFALAIKVALVVQNAKVMVFDEVDQGVGGAVAAAVGKRLATLSKNGQVFVVTHSAQVAACADYQFRIEKSSDSAITTTHVTVIVDTEREEEIARMLAGETVTQEARAAARRLMAS